MLSKIKLDRELLRIELDVRVETIRTLARTIDGAEVPGEHQVLSITASIQRRRSSQARWEETCFGQCRGEVRQYIRHLTKTHSADRPHPHVAPLTALVDLWERWHLNHMNAGDRVQRDALEAQQEHEPLVVEFERASAYLEQRGLNPHQGYTYGSAWLLEPLPPEVVEELRGLCLALGGRVLEAA